MYSLRLWSFHQLLIHHSNLSLSGKLQEGLVAFWQQHWVCKTLLHAVDQLRHRIHVGTVAERQADWMLEQNKGSLSIQIKKWGWNQRRGGRCYLTVWIFHKLFTFKPHTVYLHPLVIQPINTPVKLSWLSCVQALACLAGCLVVLTRTINTAYTLQLPVHIHSCLSTTHLCVWIKLSLSEMPMW